ncbi:hypothetical protein F2Q69_00062873, partial [Brassica cretica]
MATASNSVLFLSSDSLSHHHNRTISPPPDPIPFLSSPPSNNPLPLRFVAPTMAITVSNGHGHQRDTASQLIKNVTINDNFFPGHFPDRPIMPGVLMIEPEVGGSQDNNFFFAGIDKVRFRKPVIAGDTLVMRMTLVKFQKRFGLAKME